MQLAASWGQWKVTMGRVSYDRSWAWRIVYLSLGTLAGVDALTPKEVGEKELMT